MSSYTRTRRVARKKRGCDSCYTNIPAGDVYLECKEFPGGDAGYADAAGRPFRASECAKCATRYYRDDLLDPVPVDQVYRLGLA